MSKRKTAWRLWSLALGEKAGKHEKEADIVALVRTIILFSYMITNIFIVAGVIRHWQKERPAEAGRCLQNQ
jgi:hypothetical protein